MRRDTGKATRAPVLSPANELRGCSGKRQYETFKAAKKLAKRVRRQTEGAIEPYMCRHCHFFHLGEPAQRRDRRRVELEAP